MVLFSFSSRETGRGLPAAVSYVPTGNTFVTTKGDPAFTRNYEEMPIVSRAPTRRQLHILPLLPVSTTHGRQRTRGANARFMGLGAGS